MLPPAVREAAVQLHPHGPPSGLRLLLLLRLLQPGRPVLHQPVPLVLLLLLPLMLLLLLDYQGVPALLQLLPQVPPQFPEHLQAQGTPRWPPPCPKECAPRRCDAWPKRPQQAARAPRAARARVQRHGGVCCCGCWGLRGRSRRQAAGRRGCHVGGVSGGLGAAVVAAQLPVLPAALLLPPRLAVLLLAQLVLPLLPHLLLLQCNEQPLAQLLGPLLPHPLPLQRLLQLLPPLLPAPLRSPWRQRIGS